MLILDLGLRYPLAYDIRELITTVKSLIVQTIIKNTAPYPRYGLVHISFAC